MPAGLDDAPFLDDMNDVRILDGVDPMRDHQRRAALGKPPDRLLNVNLRFAVERRGGLVEQKNRHIADHRSRDGDPLALAAGKLHAVLADRRVVACRQRHDEIVCIGGFGRRDDLVFAGAEPAHRDVRPHGAPKQKDILADIGDICANGSLRNRRDVLPVDRHFSFMRVVETKKKVENRGLASARWTDQRGDLPGLGRE